MSTAIRNALAATAVLIVSAMPAMAGSSTVYGVANQSFATGSAAAYLAGPRGNAPRFFMRVAAPVYGKRCVTQIGTCEILPQPVGSPCMCGKVEGTTLQ